MDENGTVLPKAATNEGDGNRVVDNCDARAEEGDAPDAEMKVTDAEKPINKEKVEDKSETKAPSPFKAPPKVVNNCDVRAEEGDSPDAEMESTDNEKPINEEKMEEKSETKAPSPFKAPPMAFKLPAALPKNPKLFEGNKNKPEPTKTLDSEKNDAKIAEEKEKVDKKATDVALGPKRKSAVAALTPAQKKKYEDIPIPYKEPSWSGIPEFPYHLEVLKMGKIVETVKLDVKPFIVFGRLPTCDVPLEHPSLSRFHAVLQFRAADESPEAAENKKKGYYLMDLGSTHGTFLNKNQIEGNTFIRLKKGHMFKFGGSSRYFILQGGTQDDEEAESDLSLTQLKQLRKMREEQLKAKLAEQGERERQAKERDAKGASWGFADDAEEEEDEDDDEEIDMAKNPYSKLAGKAEHEDKYVDDPRKCLQNWYDREGEDLEYEFVEEGEGKKRSFFCRLTLPVDSEEPVIAEGEGTNKKQAKIIASLEACKILDIRGLLFQSQQESSTSLRRKKLEENDFYDSDEDEFLDRTGEIEAKRRRRMAQMGVKAEEKKALTYADLTGQLDAIRDETAEIERKLEKAKKDSEAAGGGGGEDTLDAFMSAIKSGRSLDTKTRIKLKMRLQELKKEQSKVQRLADLARPANLPPLQKPSVGVQSRGAGIWVGKMGGGKGQGSMRKPVQINLPAKKDDADDVEEEEEEEEEEMDTEGGESISADKTGSSNQSSKAFKDSISRSKDSNSIDESSSSSGLNPASTSETTESRPLEEEEEDKEEQPKDATTPATEIKVRMRIGESNSAKKKSGASSSSSVSSAVKAVGMETGPKLPEKTSYSSSKSSSKSSSSSKIDLSVSSILASRATEVYNEERMKDPQFSMWVPPTNQAGDGKTKLNDKFGY